MPVTAGTSKRPFVKKQRPVDMSGTDGWAQVIARSRMDPVWFAEHVLRLRRLPGEPSIDDDPSYSWELDLWQREMFEAAGDVVRHKYGVPTRVNHEAKELITVAACQGPGKTFGAAALLHWFGFCFKGLILCTAPKLQQVTTRLFKEVRKIGGRAVEGYTQFYSVAATRITWLEDPEWFAIAETGATPESLQGYHDKYMLVICDEMSGIPDEMVAVVRGAMSTGFIVICLMIGNPTRSSGAFFNSHTRADLAGDYYRMRVSYLNSKRVKRAWAEQMRREYGENSPIYKIRVLGQFAEVTEGQLIAPEWIQAARLRDFEGDGSVPTLRVSVDVADGGMDETVITVAKHYQSHVRVLKIFRASYEVGHGATESARRAMELFDLYGGRRTAGDSIVIDSLGVGAGTYGTVYDAGYPAYRYVGGSSADDSARYRNRRVQSYLTLRDAFKAGALSFEDDALDTPEAWAAFDGQLCLITNRPGQDRIEDIVTKDELKRQGLKSPDMADSLAMQYALGATFSFQSNDIETLVDRHVVRSNILMEYAG
jgi:hypothetical protein